MRRSLGVLGLVMLGLALVAPVAARADEACDNAVFDEAGLLASGRAAVDQAAAALAQTGAAVRVRVVGSLDGQSIDAWEAAVEQRCPAWTFNGRREAHLIVVAVAVSERKTGIWYGSNWAGALDSTWRQIQLVGMNPKFKEGDIAGGLAAGLDQLNTAVARWQAADPPVPASPGPDLPEVPDPSPSGGGGGWNGAGVAVVGVIAVAVVGVLVRLTRAGSAAGVNDDGDDGDDDDDDWPFGRRRRRRGFWSTHPWGPGGPFGRSSGNSPPSSSADSSSWSGGASSGGGSSSSGGSSGGGGSTSW